MRRVTSLFVAWSLAAIVAMAACGKAPVQPSATVAVTSVTVEGAHSLAEGNTLTLTATVHWSNGVTAAATSGVSWVSDDPRVATVDARGVVTAVKAGQSQIRATFDSVSGSTALQVTAVAVRVSGKVHESAPTEDVGVAGATVTAVGADGAGVSAVTDASGAFTLNLVPGVAQFSVAAPGYETATASVDTTAGSLSLPLVPVLQEMRESFDTISPPPAQVIDSRTFPIKVHRAGEIVVAYTKSYDLASAQAFTHLEVRDASNRVLAQTAGAYDAWAPPIRVSVAPGAYVVKFFTANPYDGTAAVSLAGFGGEVKHPN
jgi:hypothetical protein